jgi:hypothetical protein
MSKGLIIVITLAFLSVLGIITWSVLATQSSDNFDEFDRKCRDAGGIPLWTGNAFRNQILCLKKDLTIEVD